MHISGFPSAASMQIHRVDLWLPINKTIKEVPDSFKWSRKKRLQNKSMQKQTMKRGPRGNFQGNNKWLTQMGNPPFKLNRTYKSGLPSKNIPVIRYNAPREIKKKKKLPLTIWTDMGK